MQLEKYKIDFILKNSVPILVFVSLILSAYLTTYFHELGHSFVAFSYGCKENPFVVIIDPLLIASNDGPYKEGCWESLLPTEQANVAVGGLLASGLFGILFLFMVGKFKRNLFLSLLVLFLGILNFLQLASYMIVGPFDQLITAGNYSDISLILANTGANPLIPFFGGLILAVFVWYFYQGIDFHKILKIKKEVWKILFSFVYVFILIILIATKVII